MVVSNAESRGRCYIVSLRSEFGSRRSTSPRRSPWIKFRCAAVLGGIDCLYYIRMCRAWSTALIAAAKSFGGGPCHLADVNPPFSSNVGIGKWFLARDVLLEQR